MNCLGYGAAVASGNVQLQLRICAFGRYGKDKSLTLYLGHASPGKDKEANWPLRLGRSDSRFPSLDSCGFRHSWRPFGRILATDNFQSDREYPTFQPQVTYRRGVFRSRPSAGSLGAVTQAFRSPDKRHPDKRYSL
ncbi:hypothetical protein CFBP7129_28020 (plasmid) [Agrobacterium tumefaciens]|uniref:Uncharacterized protein n=1 Tax=Agrobacterium tumefaciens TaxID=358 RepID=A0A4D7YL66_AGRTU|nr:hypothetical protein CFBP7129_28020 [Agrobacterium tumefaciens]